MRFVNYRKFNPTVIYTSVKDTTVRDVILRHRTVMRCFVILIKSIWSVQTSTVEQACPFYLLQHSNEWNFKNCSVCN